LWFGRNSSYCLSSIFSLTCTLLVAELGEKHEKHLLPGSFDDGDKDKQTIDLLTDATTRLFQETKKLIKTIGEKQVDTAQEEQIKRNLQSSLATQLQELSVGFKRDQKKYLARLEGKQAKRSTLLDAYAAAPSNSSSEGTLDMGFSSSQLETVASQRGMLCALHTR
jgi:hypothetical protein